MSENTTCPACGRDDFKSNQGMMIHYAKMDNDSHEGNLAKEVFDCNECGKEIERYKCKNRKYCTECNAKGAYITDEQIENLINVSGEEHPAYGHEVTEEHRRAISKALRSSTSSYKDTSPQLGYSSAFYRNRPEVLERDGYKCRVCGVSQDEHRDMYGRGLTVHHIKPRSEFMDEGMERPPDEAGAMSNLFTVCSKCHPKVEHGKIEIPSNGNQKSAMDW